MCGNRDTCCAMCTRSCKVLILLSELANMPRKCHFPRKARISFFNCMSKQCQYMYVHIYIYIYIYTHTHTCMYVYLHIHVHTYIHTYKRLTCVFHRATYCLGGAIVRSKDRRVGYKHSCTIPHYGEERDKFEFSSSLHMICVQTWFAYIVDIMHW